jgi:mono/diheme cytochrome c family protein
MNNQRHPAPVGLVALIAILIAGAVSQTGATEGTGLATAGTTPASDGPAEIALGAYLARAGDCAACHSVPGKPDFSGGLPMHSPLGTIYSTNITPDLETGIGRYSLQDFEQALRKGIAPRHRLYPAMPYPSFAKTSDEDIRALYAYFMHGIAPVHRDPPKTALPFPFDQRWAIRLWNLAFLDSGVYRFDAGHDARWNRGAYLVQGLGHCGACHTPRGIAYEEHGYTQGSHRYLTGGINEYWFAPNLSGASASGLADWSQADLAQFLKTGRDARRMAFGPMTQVVTESLQYLDEGDLQAIAVYLKSLAPNDTPGTFLPESQARPSATWLATGDVQVPGGGLYANFCAKCHDANGRGAPGKAPALALSAAVRAVNPASVIHIVLSGATPAETAGSPKVPAMPAFAGEFDDREVAEVTSFVRRSWGNNAPPVTPRDVATQRKAIVAARK